MNIPDIAIKKLLSDHDIRPSKGLGQNFLVDDNALQQIILAADISKESEILEIGPGLGHLTRYLAASSKIVHTDEIDKKIIPALESVLEVYKNVNIINADIMNFDLTQLDLQEGYLIVANIPYYITSALIRKLLQYDTKPKRLVITVQKEVGERICAKQGNHSLLSLSVQLYGKPRISSIIKANSFFPSPKIDSAVIRIDILQDLVIGREKIPMFFRLIKAGFSQKRKMLRNTISAGMHWSKDKTEEILELAGIDPKARAQTLSIEEWAGLVNLLSDRGS